MPRVIFYCIMFNDSIWARKIYAVVLAVTTAFELGLMIIQAFLFFSNDEKYCDRAYAVYYMWTDWEVSCDWAIFLYEVCEFTVLITYILAVVAAIDHFHLGFLDRNLKKKE